MLTLWRSIASLRYQHPLSPMCRLYRTGEREADDPQRARIGNYSTGDHAVPKGTGRCHSEKPRRATAQIETMMRYRLPRLAQRRFHASAKTHVP